MSIDNNKPAMTTDARIAYRNHEGYADPTAFAGLNEAIKVTDEIDDKCRSLITTMKCIADLAGFDVIARIELRHRDSGRNYR